MSDSENQLEDLKKLSSQLEKSWNERLASNNELYSNFDLKKLSPTKKRQFDLQIDRAPKRMLRNGEYEIPFPGEWKIRFFITAEWIVADWARRQQLTHIDFNEFWKEYLVDDNLDFGKDIYVSPNKVAFLRKHVKKGIIP